MADLSETVIFRCTPEVKQRVAIVAKVHGRDPSEEMRLAWAYYDTAAMLAYLQTDAARTELGDDLPAAVENVKRNLAELTRRAFDPDPLMDAEPDPARLN